MKINNKFIYRLTDRIGTLTVEPLGEFDFSIEYDRENDEKFAYKKELNGKIVFLNEAFERLLQMEGSIYRCDQQTLTIVRKCTGNEIIVFTGKISLNEAEFNLDKCSVTVKFAEDKSDQCIEDGKNKKLNLFPLIYNRVIAKTSTVNGVIETKTCSTKNQAIHNGDPFYFCDGDPNAGNWICVQSYASNPDGYHYQITNTWKREIITINCNETADANWVLIEDNCSTLGTRKYAKKVTTINCESSGSAPDENGGYWYSWQCQVLGYDSGVSQIDNGVLLKDVLIELLNASCSNLTLKSDFFNINSTYSKNIVLNANTPKTVSSGFIHVPLNDFLVGTFTLQIWFDNTTENSFALYWGDSAWNYDTTNAIFDVATNGVKTYTFTINKPTKNALMMWFNNQTTISRIKLERGSVATPFSLAEDSINPVTNKRSTTDNIVIFQKSDVKRPTSYNNASKLELDLDYLFETLKKLFNVKWRIEGNFLRIEHVSSYSRSVGIDVTTEELKKYFIGKRVYTYESEKIPRKETFKFKEQQSADWLLSVDYSGCVTSGKNEEKITIVDEATTDIVFVMNNPSSDSKNVEDSGICIVSTRKVNNEYFINSENRPNGTILNNVFSWSILFRDFHYYERPMKTGKVNGVQTEFISTIPTKKGETFAIPYDVCSKFFNPDNIVRTLLGDGIVSSAKHRFKDHFLELDLLYESNQNLVPNNAPTLSGGGAFQTYENTPKTLTVDPYDSDGFISGLIVSFPPYNGTVNIISNTQIQYTPNAGFVGNDYFHIKALDNMSEQSNSEVFTITVRPTNQPPVANDDNYFCYIGQTWNQGVSIFSNDSDEVGFTLQTPNVTTAQGVAITINSNGFFNYTPPNGFEGVDSFQYTIADELGATATATVSINVIDRNKPIAVDDYYQTKKNQVLQGDGSLLRTKLITNDYSLNSNAGALSSTPETKPTANGGSVTIGVDGSFTYSPPLNFTGVDSFNYTVFNSYGSIIGTAFVSVLPEIYVKLRSTGHIIIGNIGDDYYAIKRDYHVDFFSDSAGTIRFNVSGLNFKVKIREDISISGSYGSNDYSTISASEILSGTTTRIFEQHTFTEQTSDGSGYYNNYNATVSIEADSSYTKI